MAPNICFKYTPLKRSREIRLVVLEKGSGEEPIHCQVFNTEFNKSTHYEALSYEWGPRSSPRREIYVNGLPYEVRKNLYDALMHFRRSNWERVLWVDRLCINQKDLTEKKHQLPMMGQIYHQAWDVLGWLGLAGESSDLAISHIRRIGLVGNVDFLNDEKNPCEDKMKAIAALCNRSYWQRIWIVQELRLARQITFYCGDKTIPGETLCLAIKHIEAARNSKISSVLKDISDSLAAKIADYTHRDDMTLKQWLITTRNSKSSDEKDRVFALINLATDCRGRIVADYRKSSSQIYKEVLRECAIDKSTGYPTFDIFDLSHILQRALNNNFESVHLTAWDNEPIWIPGIFSAKITSFERDNRRAVRYHELYPKNIFEDDKNSTNWYAKAIDCILAPEKGKGIEIISKRRHSWSATSVQTISDIVVATSPSSGHLPDTLMEPQSRPKNTRLKNPRHRGKPCLCKAQACSGFAPKGAQIGDMICRFPESRIGLVFRRTAGVRPPSPPSAPPAAPDAAAMPGRINTNIAAAAAAAPPVHWDNGIDTYQLVGRAIMDERFQISEQETETFWRGNPTDPSTVSFGSENGWFLRLGIGALQRLTGE